MKKKSFCLLIFFICCSFIACGKPAESDIITITDETQEPNESIIASDGMPEISQEDIKNGVLSVQKKILPEEKQSVNLNGVDIEISISKEKQLQENSQLEETVYFISVSTSAGDNVRIRSQLFTKDAYAIVTDLNVFDEQCELFFSQVYMSDLQYTMCLGIAKNGIYILPFSDNNIKESKDFFAGLAIESHDGIVIMQSDVQLSGTRGARCDYKLMNGMMCPSPEAELDFSYPYDLENLAATWNSYGVTVSKKSLPAEMDGEKTAIPSNTKLLFVSMNEHGLVQFMDEAGGFGSFLMGKNSEGTWTIDGEPVDDFLIPAVN